MNIMIAAAGEGSKFGAAGGTAEGAVFVALFAAAGFVLIVAANVLIRRHQGQPQVVRYTVPRL